MTIVVQLAIFARKKYDYNSLKILVECSDFAKITLKIVWRLDYAPDPT